MFKRDTIYYDTQQDQWFIKQGKGSYPLHCGEYMKLLLGKKALDCRLELDALGWYVGVEETKFLLHPNVVYAVKL